MAQQAGIIRVGQLRQSHRWEQIARWVASGELIRLGRDWLQNPRAPTDLSARFARAQLQMSEPVIACSLSAAEFYGFHVVDDGKLHLTTKSGRSISAPDDVVLHQAPPRSAIEEWADFRVIDRLDALIDTAALGREIDALAVLDAGCAVGIERDQVIGALERAGRRRGIAQARRWTLKMDSRSGSPMESRVRARILAYGLPAPDLQIRVRTSDGTKFLDLGWQEYRVGADYEGEEFHTGDGRMAQDRRRHNALADDRWQMFYPTAADVYLDHRAFVSKIERALRTAGWTGPLTPLLPPLRDLPMPRIERRPVANR